MFLQGFDIERVLDSQYYCSIIGIFLNNIFLRYVQDGMRAIRTITLYEYSPQEDTELGESWLMVPLLGSRNLSLPLSITVTQFELFHCRYDFSDWEVILRKCSNCFTLVIRIDKVEPRLLLASVNVCITANI